jgi:HAMP domain-containing protein
MKILIPVFLVTLLVIGVLSWFAFVTLHSTLISIYEQRARSVAAVVSKSIQEKEYILYYSDELDADIETLLKRYESVVSITIVGMTGRGLLVVASTDPTTVGLLVSEDEQERFSLLREIEVSRVSRGEKDYLRAYHPLLMGSDLVGVVSLEMSLEEEQRYLSTLSWQLGLGSLVGFLVLGTLLYAILHMVVTRPVFRLARAAQAVSQRNYDVEVSPGPARKPGTRVRDEVARFIGVFNLMVKVIQSREQALSEMVILDDKLRAVDPVFRVSENRFVVLFPETPAAGAQIAANRLREQSADLTSGFPFPLFLHIASTGWGPEETPKIEDVLHHVQASLDQG